MTTSKYNYQKKNIEKPVFFLSEEEVYSGNSPNYFDTQKVEGVDILEDEWEAIYNEFSSVLSDEDSISCSSPYPPNLSAPQVWKNVYFYNFMWKYHDNCKKFPITYNIINRVPNLTFGQIAILEPKGEILPHIGETNVIMRGHLGLSIPGGLPDVGIEVNGEKKGWENGKALLFSDAHKHRVWNHSEKRRMILIFDIVKEEYQDHKLWYCSQALSTLVIKGIDSHIAIIKNMPKPIQMSIHYLISFGWFLYLPLQRRISWLP